MKITFSGCLTFVANIIIISILGLIMWNAWEHRHDHLNPTNPFAVADAKTEQASHFIKQVHLNLNALSWKLGYERYRYPSSILLLDNEIVFSSCMDKEEIEQAFQAAGAKQFGHGHQYLSGRHYCFHDMSFDGFDYTWNKHGKLCNGIRFSIRSPSSFCEKVLEQSQ